MKSDRDIAMVAKDVVNLLADRDCTVSEAEDVLRVATMSIHDTSKVAKLDY